MQSRPTTWRKYFAPVLTRVPLAPASLLGLTNLSGRVIPVVSLACGRWARAGRRHQRSRVLLLRLDGPIGGGGRTPWERWPSLGRGHDGSESRRDGVEGIPAACSSRAKGLESGRRDPPGIRRVDRRRAATAARRGPAEASGAAPAARRRSLPVLRAVRSQDYALPLEDVDRSAFAAPRPHYATLPGKDDRGARDDDAARPPPADSSASRRCSGLAAAAKAPTVTARGSSWPGSATPGSASSWTVARAILRRRARHDAPVPGALLNRGSGEAQIQSIHRLPDGQGMVSILSAERLFRDETVARHPRRKQAERA